MGMIELLTDAITLAEDAGKTELAKKLNDARACLYPAKTCDEVSQMIATLNKAVNRYRFPTDLNDTRTLCRCFFDTIISLIRAEFAAIEKRNAIAFNILSRSLSEHVIDMAYIAAKDDVVLNRRFRYYYKLVRYWMRHRIEHLKEFIPIIEGEYRDYILREFQGDFAAMGAKCENRLIDWDKIDEHIRRRYKSSWSGLDWGARLDQACNLLKDHGNIASLMKQFVPLNFQGMSQYTHPTIYSVVPEYNFQTQTFTFAIDGAKIDMKEEEGFNYLALDLTVSIFSHVLGENDGAEFTHLFNSMVNRARSL